MDKLRILEKVLVYDHILRFNIDPPLFRTLCP
jgi:hypothetical protein